MQKLTIKAITFLLFTIQPTIHCNYDALADLEYMHDTLLNNHPGIYNDEDPYFINHLNCAFSESSKKIKASPCPDECLSILTDFAKSFNDAHLRVSLHNCSTQKPNHHVRKKFYSITLQENIQWITLPTFSPNDDEQKILNEIIAGMPMMRTHKIIIFDVRGNGGGSSYWGKAIVGNLFGEPYAKTKIEFANQHTYTDWRASKDNIDYLKRYYPSFVKEHGVDSEATRWLIETIDELQQAYEQGIPLCRSKKATLKIEKPEDIHNPVTAKIIVITDRGCGSACLNFIDYLKEMKHDVVLFGQTTGADSIYMDIQTVDLPSKKRTFCFPMKVYRNRPRGNNIPYYPDIPYTGDIKDTTTLQQAVLEHFY